MAAVRFLEYLKKSRPGFFFAMWPRSNLGISGLYHAAQIEHSGVKFADTLQARRAPFAAQDFVFLQAEAPSSFRSTVRNGTRHRSRTRWSAHRRALVDLRRELERDDRSEDTSKPWNRPRARLFAVSAVNRRTEGAPPRRQPSSGADREKSAEPSIAGLGSHGASRRRGREPTERAGTGSSDPC